ncbi:MAG TPA: tol-pal system protein YbgF, partial [Ancylobacter sp.]
GAPRPLGTTTPSGPVGGAQPGAPMDLGAMSGAAAAGDTMATLPPSNSPKDLFDLAYGYMLRQDYQQSAQGFRQFIQQYPNDRAAPDAYYWLGENEYLRKSYKEAAQNFLKVSADYPNAVKAPDAMLRLGQSLAAIGEKDAACATFNAVGNKYPRATATIKQGVEREQKRVGC